jgi:hypothetical protein
MATRPGLSNAKLRRQLPAKGFTPLPTCPICRQQVAVLAYAKHTRECEQTSKTSQGPPPAPQEAVNGMSGSQPATERGFVLALFDKAAVQRLERAGAELTRLRQELRDQHDSFTPAERVERCREVARVSCLTMALTLDQFARRFDSLGSGMAFLNNLRPHVAADALASARNEMVRLSDPAVWRIA